MIFNENICAVEFYNTLNLGHVKQFKTEILSYSPSGLHKIDSNSLGCFHGKAISELKERGFFRLDLSFGNELYFDPQWKPLINMHLRAYSVDIQFSISNSTDEKVLVSSYSADSFSCYYKTDDEARSAYKKDITIFLANLIRSSNKISLGRINRTRHSAFKFFFGEELASEDEREKECLELYASVSLTDDEKVVYNWLKQQQF